MKTSLIAGGPTGIAAIFRAPLSGTRMRVDSPYEHDLARDALLPPSSLQIKPARFVRSVSA
jgi:hypothetical protein